MAGKRLRQRDRTRGGESAIIEARAAQYIGDEANIGGGEIVFAQYFENVGNIVEPHVRQYDILHMGGSRLIERIFFREVGDDAHLLRGRIAGRLTDTF